MSAFTLESGPCISCHVHARMMESIQSYLHSIQVENEQLSADVESLRKGLSNFQNSLVPAVCKIQDTLKAMLTPTPPTTTSQPEIQVPEAAQAPPIQQPMEKKRKRTTSGESSLIRRPATKASRAASPTPPTTPPNPPTTPSPAIDDTEMQLVLAAESDSAMIASDGFSDLIGK
jgi:hypothetical protein